MCIVWLAQVKKKKKKKKVFILFSQVITVYVLKNVYFLTYFYLK